jgi:excisionase family DNA binding protein
MDKFLTTIQAARYLKINRVRIWQLVQEGILPERKMGRDLFFTQAELDAAKDRPGRGRPVDKKQKSPKKQVS